MYQSGQAPLYLPYQNNFLLYKLSLTCMYLFSEETNASQDLWCFELKKSGQLAKLFQDYGYDVMGSNGIQGAGQVMPSH